MTPQHLLTVIFAGLISLPTMAEGDCQQWPRGMTFVGLTDNGWHTYIVTQAGKPPQKITIGQEVRTPTLSRKDNTLFYIDDAGQLSQFSLADNKTTVLLAASKKASYAQPEIDEQNNALYVVELKQGNSVDTDILRFDLTNQTTMPLIIQRSAQFEPVFSTPWLYYGNVHCVLGCGVIIQEIWRYHTVSGMAQQLTLLNTISRQPAVDNKHQWLYFSSNAAGNYHIYRQSLTMSRQVEQLTQGTVTDMSPAVTDSRLYFIRQHSQGAALMCRTASGELVQLALPKAVKQLRSLEI